MTANHHSTSASTATTSQGNNLNQSNSTQQILSSKNQQATVKNQPNNASIVTSSGHLSFGGSSVAFQQVKQTQASLARLTRVHQLQQQQQQQQSQINQSSHQNKEATTTIQNHQKSTTFVDCLIRRFKDCFSEDFCTVPMFVVGNLSPGSDGTHLILPPCVSLGRQNISRFANPKNNLRHMNSIRDSCKSIEELDLGGNKLSDLIEVYKILQCTPNLKFLNLSENDLSKTSPVAMACCPQPSSSSSSSSYSGYATSPYQQTISAQNLQLTGNAQQRACLAPLNQNHAQSPNRAITIGARRHSTLGQSMGVNSGRQLGSRLTEARRLAATAALAQSKKTSSSMATKLANSVAAASATSSRQDRSNQSGQALLTSNCKTNNSNETTGRLCARQRQAASSTMHLARSLSSLSAKDVRASGCSLLSNRMSAHRNASNRGSAESRNTLTTSNSSGRLECSRGKQVVAIESEQSSDKQQITGKSSQSRAGLFGSISGPIAETDTDVDVDMNDSSSISVVGRTNQQQSQATSRSSVSQTGISNVSRICTPLSQTNSSSSPNFRRTFESVKALALNNTGCPWRVVCSILSRMPNLEELHLSLNNYERIDLDPNEFKHLSLKRLYLCNNPKLTSWQELDKLLSAFPSLEALSIADCNISQIPDNLDRAREWRKLCGLNINGWPIKEWPVVERLNQLPSLVDLKCRNLDVLNSIDEPRHHLIARLPKLQRLNGSEIEEREHAEKAFLRFFMANAHLERPPRFHELVQIHGEVTSVDVDVDLSPPSQASVKVIYLDKEYYRKENQDDILMSEDFLTKLMDNVEPINQQPNSLEIMDDGDNEVIAGCSDSSKPVRLFKDERQEVVAIEVDLRQTVRKFKSTIANLFGLNSQGIILYYIDHEMVGLMGPELIKHNQKKLWNYNVQDGDQFIVEER